MKFAQSEQDEILLEMLNKQLLFYRTRVVPAQNPTVSGVRYFGERIVSRPSGGYDVEMLRFPDLQAVHFFLSRLLEEDPPLPRGSGHPPDVPTPGL